MVRLTTLRSSVTALLIGISLCGCMGSASLKKQQRAAIVTAGEQCKSEFATPDLDPIRHKVELYRESTDAGIPFEIASNDAFPTDAELPAIAKWAMLRDECLRRTSEVSKPAADAGAVTSAVIRQRQFLYNQAGGRISELIVSLYQHKLTYGEFAHKRYEINRAVWMVTTAVGDLAIMLPTRVARILDLDSAQNPVLF